MNEIAALYIYGLFFKEHQKKGCGSCTEWPSGQEAVILALMMIHNKPTWFKTDYNEVNLCLSIVFSLLMTITNNVSSALSVAAKSLRFLHAAFDVNGDSFIAGDHQGNIYLFDLSKNRYVW